LIKPLDNLPLAVEIEKLTGHTKDKMRKYLSESGVTGILNRENKSVTKKNLQSLADELEIMRELIENYINSIGD
jgi:hypothetical protein